MSEEKPEHSPAERQIRDALAEGLAEVRERVRSGEPDEIDIILTHLVAPSRRWALIEYARELRFP